MHACVGARRLRLTFPPRAGKSERITITNDKGRLSQEDIDRMVLEAEEFAEQDKKVKGRVDAKNALETYVYNLRSSVDDKLGEKLSPDDRDTVRAAGQGTVSCVPLVQVVEQRACLPGCVLDCIQAQHPAVHAAQPVRAAQSAC